MAQLTPAFFSKILRMEGGWQDRADDTGNYCDGQLIGTKYGVSAGAFNVWTGRCPTVDEMKALTTDQAFNFYAWYFNLANLYQIENQQFFELLANNTMGAFTAAPRVEQKALNRLGYNVAVDGKRGPQTVAALNDAWRKNPTAIYNTVREEWIAYLKSLNKPQFLPGWLDRMNKNFPPMAGFALGGGALALILLAIYLWKK